MCSRQKSIKYYRLSSAPPQRTWSNYRPVTPSYNYNPTNQVLYDMPQQALPDTPQNPEAQLKMGERLCIWSRDTT